MCENRTVAMSAGLTLETFELKHKSKHLPIFTIVLEQKRMHLLTEADLALLKASLWILGQLANVFADHLAHTLLLRISPL